jgi:orotidine-5'-phosphate decarboxylase
MKNSVNFNDKIIIALDYDGLKPVKNLLDKLEGRAFFYKVGFELFTSCGEKSVKFIKERGCKVFLDLKYHDIPNTVYKAVKAAGRVGADIINVHASGGTEMMSAAKKAADEASEDAGRHIDIIAVTVLTSLSDGDINRIFYDYNDYEEVMQGKGNEYGVCKEGISSGLALHLARLAKISKLDGVVCSGRESINIKKTFGNDFKTVTPGIRTKTGSDNKITNCANNSEDDQKRVMTPSEAFNAAADYIVIGREITGAADPADALDKICADIKNNVNTQKI